MLHRTLTKLRTPKSEREEGFTLIELLVVVVIIGILIAIAIPVYLNYQKGAANKAAGADTRNAVAAVEQCASQNGNAYPASTTANTASGNGAQVTLTCSGGNQTMNVSPNDVLTYTLAGDGKTYTIVTKAGGRGDKQYTYSSSTGQTVEAAAA